MRRTLVYALMLMLGVTAVLSSCSSETNYYDPTAADQVQHNKFKEAFENAFGKVAPNVDWGFNDAAEEAAMTRGDEVVADLTAAQVAALTDEEIKALSENAKRTYLRQLVESGINIGLFLDIYQLDAFGFKRIVCEDLAVSENSDFDYNDAVFDAKRMDEAGSGNYATFYTILRAEGARKIITIGNAEGAYEVHEAFGVTNNTFVNTVGKPRPIADGAYWHKDKDPVVKIIKVAKKANGQEPTLIDIPVIAEGNRLPLTAKRGEPAEKLCVNLDYSWVREKDHMGSAEWYPKFAHYVTGKANTSSADTFGKEESWWYISDDEWRTPEEDPGHGEVTATQLYEATAKIRTIKNETFGTDIEVHYFNNGIGYAAFEEEPTEIIASGFKDATALTKMYLPCSVTTIGDYAFSGCTNLQSIDISKVTSLGRYAFEGCSSLTSISVPGCFKSISTGTFKDCSNLSNVSLMMYIESIGDWAFAGCTSIAAIDIPYATKQIGESSFEGCTGLTRISFAPVLQTIGKNAFAGCTGVATITIPSNVNSIVESAFSGCTSLTSVEIQGYLTMGPKVFENCTSLTTVTIRSTTPPVGNIGDIFKGCNNLTYIYVPAESVDAYKSSSAWKSYAKYITAIQEQE